MMLFRNETKGVSNMDNGNKLKILRNQAGYSQQEVADKLEVSKSKYCRIENNETTLDVIELKKILGIYNISAEDFLQIKLPLIRTISFPKKLLDELEMAINQNTDITDNWNSNRERFNLLRKSLKPVLEIRDKAFDFPELNLEEIESGKAIKTVQLDMRGEELINKCLKLQDKYCRVLFGGES